MLVEAKCIHEAFDNTTCIHYRPGIVPNFDTENVRLNSLTVPGGMYVFQYPGHEGKAPKKEVQSVPASTPHVDTVIQERVQGSRGRPMTEAHKAKLKAAREKARAAKIQSAAA